MFVDCVLFAWFCVVCFDVLGRVVLVLVFAFGFGVCGYLHVLGWVWFAWVC